MRRSRSKSAHKCIPYNNRCVQNVFQTVEIWQYEGIGVAMIKNWGWPKWTSEGIEHFWFYYRATLFVSAVFAVARCLSVCLSVTFVHCIHPAEAIVTSLLRLSSPIIIVSCLPAQIPNSKGNPFSGGAKYTGLEKFAIS